MNLAVDRVREVYEMSVPFKYFLNRYSFVMFIVFVWLDDTCCYLDDCKISLIFMWKDFKSKGRRNSTYIVQTEVW